MKVEEGLGGEKDGDSQNTEVRGTHTDTVLSVSWTLDLKNMNLYLHACVYPPAMHPQDTESRGGAAWEEPGVGVGGYWWDGEVV